MRDLFVACPRAAPHRAPRLRRFQADDDFAASLTVNSYVEVDQGAQRLVLRRGREPPAHDQVVEKRLDGCLACDLMEDFRHAKLVALCTSSELTAEQQTLLDRIDSAFEAMEAADHTCFDNSVVERPAWAAVRAIAADSLRGCGWEHAMVAPFEEVEPGVWRRPPAGG